MWPLCAVPKPWTEFVGEKAINANGLPWDLTRTKPQANVPLKGVCLSYTCHHRLQRKRCYHSQTVERTRLILVQENYRTPSATWSTTSCGRFATPVEVANKSGLAAQCAVPTCRNLARGCFLGLGRSTALFYAKSQLQETGATVSLNQTDVMATAFQIITSTSAPYIKAFGATNSLVCLQAGIQCSWKSRRIRPDTA